MAMSEKEYFNILLKTPNSKLNVIIDAVNRKHSKEEAGLKNEFEEMFYDKLWKEAEEHVKKYEEWPVFEMGEIESEDPILDIYKDPPGKWAADRKKN